MNTMARWNVAVLAALVGLTVALPAEAQWKWRDKSGRTQYSDLPPPAGTADQDVLQRPNVGNSTRGVVAAGAAASVASAAPLLAPRSSDPELEARRKKAAQDGVEKKQAEEARIAAGRAENCTRATAQMRTFDSGMRLTRINEKGEREYLDDAARAAEAKRTREVMASECK